MKTVRLALALMASVLIGHCFGQDAFHMSNHPVYPASVTWMNGWHRLSGVTVGSGVFSRAGHYFLFGQKFGVNELSTFNPAVSYELSDPRVVDENTGQEVQYLGGTYVIDWQVTPITSWIPLVGGVYHLMFNIHLNLSI
jgi:hypothetical protein